MFPLPALAIAPARRTAGQAALARVALFLLLGSGVPARAGAQATAVHLDVPFVAQTVDLCGGAAAAMLFRYWGDTHASARQFEPLVDHRAGGIADTALVAAIRDRHWNADRVPGSIAALREELAARRPLMLLLEDRPGRYHYVVAVGADEHSVLLHDPTWGPDRRYSFETLQVAWKPSGFWTLRITPSSSLLPSPAAPPLVAPPRRARTTCDERLDAALDEIALRGLDHADAVLLPLAASCPDAAGPLREMAGVRFAQQRWLDASTFAAAALARDPRDAYAADVLGSSRFMRHDEAGALRAWNRASTPTLDTVKISGLTRTRYAQVTQALGLPVDGLLSADAFETARRRLQQFPMFTATRLSLRPLEDHYAAVDVAVVERGGPPRGVVPWAVAAVRAGLEREATVTSPGWSGQGETWTAGVRWWTRRPSASLAFAAPFTTGPRGVWRVDLGWARQTYGATTADDIREDRLTGRLGVASWVRPNLRLDASVSLDGWQKPSGHFRTIGVETAVDQRLWRDRVSLSANAGRWFAPGAQRPFGSAWAAVEARTSAEPRRFVLAATGGGSLASADSPLALWNGAGDGRGRTPLLRAHPLLDDGRVEGPVFGRRLVFASVEAQHWLARPSLVRVALAAFADAAQAADRLASARGLPRQVDIGTGLRVRPPGGSGFLRVDYAHGVRDGADRVFIGWQR